MKENKNKIGVKKLTFTFMKRKNFVKQKQSKTSIQTIGQTWPQPGICSGSRFQESEAQKQQQLLKKKKIVFILRTTQPRIMFARKCGRKRDGSMLQEMKTNISYQSSSCC